MGFYVVITKDHEEDDIVIYQFGPDERNVGYLRLNKSDGETAEVQPVRVTKPQAYFVRASVKLRQHWERGEYPDKTSWES